LLLASLQLLIPTTSPDHPPVTVPLTGYPVAIAGVPVAIEVWAGVKENTRLTIVVLTIALLLNREILAGLPQNRKILAGLPLDTVVLKSLPVDLEILIKARGHSHHPDRRDITVNGKM